MSLYTTSTAPTAPATYTEVTTLEVLMLDEVLSRMNQVSGEDDTVIYNQIMAVRYALERKFNMSFAETKTITAHYDYFGDRVYLPLPPVISVTAVYLVDETGTESATTNYYVFGGPIKYLKVNELSTGGLKVVYQAGVTDVALKALIKDALLSEVMMWYFQRGNGTENNYRIGEIASSKLGFLTPL